MRFIREVLVLCSLGLAAAGCVTEQRVLQTEDADNVAGSPAMPAAGSMGLGYPAAWVDRRPKMPPELPDREACEDSATSIIGGVDGIYGLTVTSTKVYVASNGKGVQVGNRAGGADERLLEGPIRIILADDQRLFWSDAFVMDLNVQDEEGESSVFLTADGSIKSVAQDADSLYVVADGHLSRVSKQDKTITILAEGGSAIAVDASFVYFLSDSWPDTNLERIRKDGSDRELLAGSPHWSEQVELLVDDEHVYVASTGAIDRVALTGGEPESFAELDDIATDIVIAQDRSCVYYADRHDLICLSKADGSRSRVLWIDDGSIRKIAVADSDLYIGVSVDSPSFAPMGWVGRVVCGPEN